MITGCANDVSESDVDIDLSELSMTMIQAEYARILSNADDYSGKTIRVVGAYYTLFFENPGTRFHYIIIIPGDECCQEGFEFRRAGDYDFPGDYPSQNAMIQITGTLRRDEDIGLSYLYIAVDDFLVISG
jgi:hypothetical protein